MLPAGNRLRRRQDFATAVRRGRRAGRPHLVAHLHFHLDPDADQGEGSTPTALPPTATESPPKVGFVVSRAVGGAVVRNTIRRRLRHLARDRLNRLPPGSLFVVRALPPAAGASSTELADDLDSALDRLLRANRPRRGGASAASKDSIATGGRPPTSAGAGS